MSDEASLNQAISNPNLISHEKPKAKERVWEIDFLRGATILGMIIDHLLYDLSSLNLFFSNFYKVASPELISFVRDMNSYYFGPVRQFFHALAILFFLLSGISCSFSHNNFRHAGKILLFSGVLTVATYAVFFITYAMGSPLDLRIMFGVLYVLGMGVLLVAVIQFIPGSKWIELGLGATILLAGLLYGFLVFKKGQIYDWTSFWNEIFFIFDTDNYLTVYTPQNAPNVFALITGFDVKDFFISMFGFGLWGADYFPLFPWVGFTLIGAFLGETLYKEKKSLFPKIDARWHKPVDWFGSKSLYVYILHQPLWLLILFAIFLPMGFRLF